jgi:hypothetical protein
MMRRYRDVAALLVGFVAWGCVIGSATPAMAFDNMYKTSNADWNCWDGSQSHGAFCQTDNASLTVYSQTSLSSASRSEISKVLAAQYSPTDLAVSVKTSGVYSGGSETDIIYQRSTTGMSSTQLGQTWCDDAVTSTKCDQEYIRYVVQVNLLPELVCHETGHAVGLTHGDDASPKVSNTNSSLGCMETPDSEDRTGLGSHNISEINATY